MKEHDEYKVIFDRLPHLARKMLLLWGHPEFDEFVGKLFTDTRDGKRQGLPPDVAAAIFKLHVKHQTEFPHTVKPVSDIWGIHSR